MLSCPTKQDTKCKEKFVGTKFRRTVSCLFLLYTQHVMTTCRCYCDYLQISMPKMLWRVVAKHVMCGGLQNQRAWMTSYVFDNLEDEHQ